MLEAHRLTVDLHEGEVAVVEVDGRGFVPRAGT